ncbi:peptide ABC transporter [Kaistia sp. 32K]|uniref:ABC transporter ATP-binding protein n=1 Tax=Kaistia sp. 32K TaxID=2795690 RepID=UPI0019153A50|nr:ATP-binding cassette domain-containing protein [Kaistia sp. 32K]BCP55918.1 peptide ABC transporter [Kaistia sp. 32K]
MLEARDIRFGFGGKGKTILDGVSLAVAPGEIVGLSGPSGIGKSTLGRILAQHVRPQAGRVLVDGGPVAGDGFHPVQFLSQSPVLAVNPRWRVGQILAEAWQPDAETCTALGIRPDWYPRYPHELSGGELQRVAIARALAPGLRYLIADEISAMLDALTQVRIWTFLKQLAADRNIGILAISHDQALLARISTRCETIGGGRA